MQSTVLKGFKTKHCLTKISILSTQSFRMSAFNYSFTFSLSFQETVHELAIYPVKYFSTSPLRIVYDEGDFQIQWVISGAMTQCLLLTLCENHFRTIGNFHKRKFHFYTVLEIINQISVIFFKRNKLYSF